MEIRIERGELLRGLETVGRFVPTKTTAEILKNVYIKAAENTLTFAGTDLSVYCQCSLKEAEVKQEGEVLIPYKTAYEVVKKIAVGEEITLKKEEQKVIITARNFNFKCTTIQIEDHATFFGPDIPETPTAKMPAKDLIQSIFKVKDAAAPTEDISRPILASILLERKDGILNVVALDGFRMAWAHIKNKGEDFTVTVNAKTLADVCKVLDPEKDTELYATEKIAVFKQDNMVIKTSVTDGQFIDYRKLFDSNKKDEAIIEAINDDLISAVERASIIAAEKEYNLVKLKITNTEMTVTSDSENAMLTDKVAVDYKGQAYKIAFNAKFLLEALKNHDEKVMVFSDGSSVSPWVITSDSGLKTLVIPVRIVEREEEKEEKKAS